jgi:hypothetical protein
VLEFPGNVTKIMMQGQPGYFMNCCRETTKIGVPPGNRPAVTRDWSEAYLNGTSQGEPVLSLSKEHPRTPGRTAISVVAASDS